MSILPPRITVFSDALDSPNFNDNVGWVPSEIKLPVDKLGSDCKLKTETFLQLFLINVQRSAALWNCIAEQKTFLRPHFINVE